MPSSARRVRGLRFLGRLQRDPRRVGDTIQRRIVGDDGGRIDERRVAQGVSRRRFGGCRTASAPSSPRTASAKVFSRPPCGTPPSPASSSTMALGSTASPVALGARTEHLGVGDGSVEAPVEGGDASGDQLHLGAAVMARCRPATSGISRPGRYCASTMSKSPDASRGTRLRARRTKVGSGET